MSSAAPHRSIVILTGAGISAESGLRTFRAADGLWEEHRVEDVATPEGFARDPVLVHRFYNERRKKLASSAVAPNSAHEAVARLERTHTGRITLVTQNIDDLHERAGSRAPIHMHGELRKIRCARSGRVSAFDGELSVEDLCDCCDAAGTLRPHVVWFGELPLQMEEIYAELSSCDLFIAIGTSGNVYPAAGFAAEARAVGARTVELNLEPSAVRTDFDDARHGLASDVVPAFVDELLGNARL